MASRLARGEWRRVSHTQLGDQPAITLSPLPALMSPRTRAHTPTQAPLISNSTPSRVQGAAMVSYGLAAVGHRPHPQLLQALASHASSPGSLGRVRTHIDSVAVRLRNLLCTLPVPLPSVECYACTARRL